MIRVIGFNFSKISVEKKTEVKKGLKINTNIDVKDLKKTEIDVFKEKDVFEINYEFKITYNPNVADIEFKGNMLILVNDKDLVKQLEENWKDKKLLEELRIPIINLIWNRCNLKALQLEEDLGLPPHIPSPKLESSSK